jgi:RNA polymerase sigma-70 factor (ECF subfamily)
VAQNPCERQTGRISAWAPGEEEALATDPAIARDDAECELLERVAAGDREALTELYHAYARRLFAFLGRLAPDLATAEELVQDTLLAVWRSAGTFQRRSTVRTWV